MAIAVRDETPDDYAAIRDAVTAAFGRPDEASLVERLRADGDCAFSLVAVDRSDLVGHIAFSPMTAPFPALGLAPVSVVPHRQRSGIGGQLIRAGLERAAQNGCVGVFVVGEPGYYSRFGFDAELASGFISPYAGPYLMIRPLVAALPTTTGRIGYAPAFAAFE